VPRGVGHNPHADKDLPSVTRVTQISALTDEIGQSAVGGVRIAPAVSYSGLLL
jgi:hypothetical protein